MKYVKIEDTLWPVDRDDDEDKLSVQWTLRYGTTENREKQRMEAASVLAAYAHLTDPGITFKMATDALRRARKAHVADRGEVNFI